MQLPGLCGRGSLCVESTAFVIVLISAFLANNLKNCDLRSFGKMEELGLVYVTGNFCVTV